VKLDVDGKRVSIPESMCQKILDKLLVVNNTPMDIYIAPRDPQNKGTLPATCSPKPNRCRRQSLHSCPVLTEAVLELGGKCVQGMSPTSVMIASPQAVALAQPTGFVVVSSTWLVRLVRCSIRFIKRMRRSAHCLFKVWCVRASHRLPRRFAARAQDTRCGGESRTHHPGQGALGPRSACF
jgi:hypothetical protein